MRGGGGGGGVGVWEKVGENGGEVRSGIEDV